MAHQMDKETARQLVDGTVSWQQLRNDILPDPKDANRFDVIREVLQEKVDWDDEILVPLNDHLFVVATDEGRRVKSACGHELCDASENWKTECRVRVRENQSEMNDLYNDWQSPDTDWEFQLREFMCPECFTMLDVEAVPAGYPVVHRFEPDIDVFYEEWLGREAPDSV